MGTSDNDRGMPASKWSISCPSISGLTPTSLIHAFYNISYTSIGAYQRKGEENGPVNQSAGLSYISY